MVVTSATPNVVLRGGSAGTNTIYTNGTSATSSLSSYFTYYPGSYNNVSGNYVSGTLPSSVQTIDNNYFISGSGGTTTAYNASSFILDGGTKNVSGTISNLAASNDQFMTFNSYTSSFYDYQYATNESSVSTTSATYVTRVRLVWTPPVTDNYLIMGYAELSPSSTNAVQAQLTVNGTAVAEAIETPVGSNFRPSISLVYVTHLSGGVSQTVTLDYRSGSSGVAVTITNARVTAVRVGSLQIATQTPLFTLSQTTSSTYVTDIQLSFTPSVAGDNWLIISHAEAVATTTGTVGATNLLLDSTTQLHNSTDATAATSDWYPTSAFKVVNLGGGSHTVTIQYEVLSGSGKTNIRNSRIYAIDLTALTSLYTTVTSEAASSYSTNTALQVKANLTWTPPASSVNYTIWGVGEVSSAATTNMVTVDMKFDTSIVATENVTVTNANEWKSFFFRYTKLPVSGGSHTVLIQYATNIAGQAVKIKDVRILAWKLPVYAQQTVSIEFTGSSNNQNWGALTWTMESNFNVSSLPVVIQLWNYTAPAGYSSSGYGYITYTSSTTSGTDQTLNQTILNPTSFKDASGNWKVKISVSNIVSQFPITMSVDWVQYKRLPAAIVEFVTTGITSATPNSLNFTAVSAWNVGSVSVTVQAFNYTTGASGAYPLSGQGYATYTSSATSTNQTQVLSITTNPTQFLSAGQAKIRISGVLSPGPFQLQVNLLVLYVFAVSTPGLYYPTGYNVVQGQYSSGSVPGSVNVTDTNYFVTSSLQASSHISSPASKNATLPDSQQRFFQNTRGQKAYYVFYRDTLSSSDQCWYAYSTNGNTWTTGQGTTLTSGYNSCSVIFREGSAQTLVYLVASTTSTGPATTNAVVFNVGTIADSATTISWSTLLTVKSSSNKENEGFPVIAQQSSGYLDIVFGYTLTGVGAFQGIEACSSSAKSPTTTSSLTWTCNTKQVTTAANINGISYVPQALPNVGSSDILIITGTCSGAETVLCVAPATGVTEYTCTLSWTGSTQTLCSSLTTAFVISASSNIAPADLRSAIVNATSQRIHFLYYDGANLLSRYSDNPYSTWTSATTVNTGASSGVHLSVSMGFGSTPKLIFAFYNNGNGIYSRNATDSESWGAAMTEYFNATVVPKWVTTPYVMNNATGISNSFTYIPMVWVQQAATAELWFTTHNFAATTRTASTEFTYTIPAVSTIQLNFTIVQQYTVASASVTIQVFNYTSGSYQASGQAGYLTYTSSSTAGTDETRTVVITSNPNTLVSGVGGTVKVKLTGQLSVLSNFNQKANLVQLYYYQQTYDYVLKIVNNQSTSYTIRLNTVGLSQTNIARFGNFTAWFHDGTTSAAELQVLTGSLTTPTGPLTYTLSPSATVYLAIRITTTNVGSSAISCSLQIYASGSSTQHTDYRLTFNIS